MPHDVLSTYVYACRFSVIFTSPLLLSVYSFPATQSNEDQIKLLKKRYETLQAENVQLREENKKLKTEIEKLKNKSALPQKLGKQKV